MIEIEASGITPENIPQSRILSVIQQYQTRYPVTNIYPCKYAFSVTWLTASSGSSQ